MLSLFRTNQASAGFLLFFYALLLQLPAWWAGAAPAADLPAGGIAGRWLMSWGSSTAWWSYLLPVVLVTVQGIIANVLVTRHRMSRKITQFPGLFIVLCWALVPAFRALHPLQAANVFVLLSLLSLGRVYKHAQPAVALFNGGAWLGLASLFHPPCLSLLPAFLIGIGTLRRPDFRSFLQFLTGTSVVFFLTFSLCYFIGTFQPALDLQFSGYGLWQWLPVPRHFRPGLAVLGLLLPVALFTYATTVRLLNIEGKKNVSILLVLLLVTLGVTLLWSGGGWAGWQLILVPLGIIIGLRFILLQPKYAGIYHLLLLVTAVGPLLYAAFA